MRKILSLLAVLSILVTLGCGAKTIQPESEKHYLSKDAPRIDVSGAYGREYDPEERYWIDLMKEKP